MKLYFSYFNGQSIYHVLWRKLKIGYKIVLTLFRLGGGGGAFDTTQDLNPLLLMNDCVYSVPTS